MSDLTDKLKEAPETTLKEVNWPRNTYYFLVTYIQVCGLVSFGKIIYDSIVK